MATLDEEVKDWFRAICQGFADAKFVVQDKGKKESAVIVFPAALQKSFGFTKQFATVQYMGGSDMKPKYYDTMEIRFYKEGLEKTGLKDIVESQKSLQKQQWNGPNPYYHYNIFDIEQYERYIKPILKAMEERLQRELGEVYKTISREEVPVSLRDLPRYGSKR